MDGLGAALLLRLRVIGACLRHNMLRRRFASSAVACALLAACANPTATITATAFTEEDTASYLILTDQLERVRNVLKSPASVCPGALPNGRYRGLSTVPNHVVDRLNDEQANAAIRLEIQSSFECLAHYVPDKGSLTPERSDILALAGRGGGSCGEWFGGMYNQGNVDRSVDYNIEVEDGIARLTGGRGCAGSLRWYRS